MEIVKDREDESIIGSVAKHGDSQTYIKMSQQVEEQSKECPLHLYILAASAVVLERQLWEMRENRTV